VLRELKKKAAGEGRTLQAVVNEQLKRAAAVPAGPPYRLRVDGWRAELQPGVDLLDRSALFDLMNGR
jgi:hypothetical protein